ncbi:MAG: hypothetical protein K6A23_11355 [Butyrivibrio sp.]|nr:hypothetical protein [Butyrivibrio sp.]
MARVSQDILDSFIADFFQKSYDIVVSKWIVENIPAIFNEDKDEYLRIKALIAQGLKVDMCSVVFVGSSCTGFSLNPKKNFKKFDSDSDIDIAIISHHHFNIAWRWMRQIDMSTLNGKERYEIKEHRKHFVFDGTIATDYILPLLPFGKLWGSVLLSISNEPIFGGREIHFRLYQDHKSLIDYHVNNVKKNLPSILGVEAKDELLNKEIWKNS